MIDLIDGADRFQRDAPDTVIIGVSTAIRRAVDLARRFAASHIPILLVGETGTG